MDDPQHRDAVLDQGHVEREFAVFLDELLGAIQRIDDPRWRIGQLQRSGGSGAARASSGGQNTGSCDTVCAAIGETCIQSELDALNGNNALVRQACAPFSK